MPGASACPSGWRGPGRSAQVVKVVITSSPCTKATVSKSQSLILAARGDGVGRRSQAITLN